MNIGNFECSISETVDRSDCGQVAGSLSGECDHLAPHARAHVAAIGQDVGARSPALCAIRSFTGVAKHRR